MSPKRSKDVKMAEPKPHDTREPEYNGDDDDAIMEDIEDTGKGHKGRQA